MMFLCDDIMPLLTDKVTFLNTAGDVGPIVIQFWDTRGPLRLMVLRPR